VLGLALGKPVQRVYQPLCLRANGRAAGRHLGDARLWNTKSGRDFSLRPPPALVPRPELLGRHAVCRASPAPTFVSAIRRVIGSP
jgi:hypothetical protein